MEKRTNKETLDIIEDAAMRAFNPDNNSLIVRALIQVIRTQQQEIEQLDKRIAETELRDKLGQ